MRNTPSCLSARSLLALAVLAPALLAAPSGWAGAKEEALLAAVRGGDLPAIRSALAQRADPNHRLTDQSTVLAWAVDRQNAEAVRLLLAAGAKTEFADLDGAKPLTIACQLADSAIVDLLLDAKADVRAARPDGVSALGLCAGTATPAVVERLIAKGALVDAPDLAGQTPLMRAIAAGRIDNFTVLLQHGADVNRATKKGLTPLFFALRAPDPKAAQAVLDAGGDRHHRTADGTSAVQMAVYQKKLGFAAALVALGGVDLEATDVNGLRLLHVAAKAGNADFARLLLAKGADPNGLLEQSKLEWRVEANRGGTVPKVTPVPPLLIAAQSGSEAMMKLLVQGGASPDFVAEDGTNVVLAAAGGGKLAALEYALSIAPSSPADLEQAAAGMRWPRAMQMLLAKAEAPDTIAMMRLLAAKGAYVDPTMKIMRGATLQDLLDRAPEPVKAAFADIVKARNPFAPSAAKSAPAPALVATPVR